MWAHVDVRRGHEPGRPTLPTHPRRTARPPVAHRHRSLNDRATHQANGGDTATHHSKAHRRKEPHPDNNNPTLSGLPIETIRALLSASCTAQGIPVKVTDTRTVRAIATLLTPGTRRDRPLDRNRDRK